VVNAMTSHFDIEVSVLQALSYCLYEMMDNVHIHSGKPLGTAMTQYDDQLKVLRILIADDGMGIRESLAENEKYKDITEPMPQRNITKHLLKQENWNRYGRIQIYRLRNGLWNPRHGTETS